MTWRTQRKKQSRRHEANPKTQIPSNIQTQISKKNVDDPPKPRDLEQRTFLFAQSVRAFVKMLPRTIGNIEDVRQLVRASGSVAANWIEADEALSKKDFLMRAKICRKEVKESRLFLRLIEVGTSNISSRDALAVEAYELTLIFSTIISKSGGS
jgi:four helix bundle protein